MTNARRHSLLFAQYCRRFYLIWNPNFTRGISIYKVTMYLNFRHNPRSKHALWRTQSTFEFIPRSRNRSSSRNYHVYIHTCVHRARQGRAASIIKLVCIGVVVFTAKHSYPPACTSRTRFYVAQYKGTRRRNNSSLIAIAAHSFHFEEEVPPFPG